MASSTSSSSPSSLMASSPNLESPPPPVFICVSLVVVEQPPTTTTVTTIMSSAQPPQQHNPPHQQGTVSGSSSSGAHSGTSPQPSLSSGVSSASQDSAICASSSTAASSPLPPPDPGGGQMAPASAAGNGHMPPPFPVQNPVLYLAWLSVDPLEEEEDEGRVAEKRSCYRRQMIRLDCQNALEQLEKLAHEATVQNHAGVNRPHWLVCSRRALRQSLYPLCAQSLLNKLTDEGEEHVFSAQLPVPTLFHQFLPFPLTNSSSPPPPPPPSSSSECRANGEQHQQQQEKMVTTTAGVEELLERRVQQMATALLASPIGQLAKSGKLDMNADKWLESIQQGYKPALCMDGHCVNPRTIVRARGLPWQVSDLDVALFFAGLDIEIGGIALCLGPEGRRNGECLVRFQRAEHRDWALERHRRHLRQRYIEVYRAGAEDFVRHAVGIDRSAVDFAQLAERQQQQQKSPAVEEGSNNTEAQPMIIRMRGLPFTATEQQIREFFVSDSVPSGILDQGILFLQRSDGRPSGDAFVHFGDEQSCRRALQKHRQRMGSRYIELFRTTQAEVIQLFNARQQAISAMNGHGCNAQNGGGIATQLGTLQHQQNGTNGGHQQHRASVTLQQALPVLALGGLTTQAGGCGTQPTHQQQHQQQPKQRDCLRLRGLPYEAQVQQVVEFLGPHSRHVLFQGVHMIYNAAGHPSGEAFIQMECEQAAIMAAQECHNKFMELGKKRRYIEVFQCCAEDMSLLLNVLPAPTSAAGPLPPAGGAPGLLPTPIGVTSAPGPPPLIPLAFTPSSAGAAPSPLLAFPATTGPFLSPFGAGTPTDPNGTGLLFPQFAAPLTQFTQLYSPADQIGTIPHDFWLRNGFQANAFRGAATIPMMATSGTFGPTPLLPTMQPIAMNGGTIGGQ